MKIAINRYAVCIIIIFLGVGVYANSINGTFILDDTNLVQYNRYIKSLSFVPRMFVDDPGSSSGADYNFYRPIQFVSYAIDYLFWGLDVRGYHLMSGILHILTVLALYALAFLLSKDKFVSFVTALLFLTHPIHVEAVSFISGRCDILSTLFLLLSFLSYIALFHKNRPSSYWFMGLCYLMALFSKESSLVFPFLFLLYHYAFNIRIKKGPFLLIGVITIGYLILRILAVRPLLFSWDEFNGIPQRVPAFLAAIRGYLQNLIVPYGLHVKMGQRLFELKDPNVIGGLIILAALFIICVALYKMRNRLLFFSMGLFLIALLPAFNIYSQGPYMADRWLYLPSMGFCLVAGWLLNRLYIDKKFKIIGILLSIMIVTGYSLLTYKQNAYWSEPISFFQRTLMYSPENPEIHHSLGNAYSAAGKNSEAFVSYKKAIEIESEYADVYNDMGNTYYYIGRLDDAIFVYKKAVEIDPESAKFLYNLANAYQDSGNIEEAVSLYRQAIEKNPSYVMPYNNLSEALYRHKGYTEEAIALLEKAIDIDPSYLEPYNNLAVIYSRAGETEEAIKLLQRVVRMDPNHTIALGNLTRLCYHIGNYEAAVTYADRFLKMGCEIDPEFLKLLDEHR